MGNCQLLPGDMEMVSGEVESGEWREPSGRCDVSRTSVSPGFYTAPDIAYSWKLFLPPGELIFIIWRPVVIPAQL